MPFRMPIFGVSQRAGAGLLAGWLALAASPAPLRADAAEDAAGKGNKAYSEANYDQAIAQYSEAIRLNPNDGISYATRGLAYFRKRDFDKAIADFNDFIRLSPDSPDGYIYRGDAYGRKRDYDHAIADYTVALRITPEAFEAYFKRALAYENSGDHKKALSDCARAIEIQPSFANGYNEIAWILATCPTDSIRNGSKAVKYATKASTLTQWKIPATIDTLAAANAEAGNFDEAVKWEKQFLTSRPPKKIAAAANQRLSLYEQKQPYRDEKKAAPAAPTASAR
jgi:tetratricopeptide (TPR) repeat protein